MQPHCRCRKVVLKTHKTKKFFFQNALSKMLLLHFFFLSFAHAYLHFIFYMPFLKLYFKQFFFFVIFLSDFFLFMFACVYFFMNN